MSSSASSSRRRRRSPARPREALRHAAATLLLAAAVAAPAPARAAEVVIDVSKAAERTIAVALPPVAAIESPDESTLRQVLENDLLLSGYFRVLPNAAPLLALADQERGAAQPDLGAWSALGAELLLRVNAVRQDGRMAVRAALFDAGARTQLFARDDTDAPSEAPRLAHRIADAVMRALTGAPGLALTRITATWSEGGGPKRVVVMDYDGRNLRPLSAEGLRALSPAWFPDGSRVAYTAYRRGAAQLPEIVSQNVTSGQVRSLAAFPGMNGAPAISPDGRQMLLVLSRDGNPEVYRMAVDGTELKRLTFTQDVETSPAWSPDGSQVALVSDAGSGATRSPQIHLVGANGGRLRRVSYISTYATSPDWSPRGGRLVYTARIEGTFQLVLLDLATGREEQVTFDGDHKESPSFAPDGRHVVCSVGRGSSYRLVIIDTLTGASTPVTRARGSFTSPAWSR